MASRRITTNLSVEVEGSEGVDATPVPTSAARRDEENDAVRIFDRGVIATATKAQALAFELGMSEQHLSDYRTGKRVLAAHRLVRLIKKDPNAAMAIIGELCDIAGLAAPRRKRKVSKNAVQRQLALELRALAPVYALLRRSAAEKLGADENQIDEVLDDETGDEQKEG